MGNATRLRGSRFKPGWFGGYPLPGDEDRKSLFLKNTGKIVDGIPEFPTR